MQFYIDTVILYGDALEFAAIVDSCRNDLSTKQPHKNCYHLKQMESYFGHNSLRSSDGKCTLTNKPLSVLLLMVIGESF